MSVKKITLIEFFLWLFILTLIIAFLSPFVYGFKIKYDYPNIVQMLSKSLHIKINIIQYEQGFFSSTLDLAIEAPGLDGRILVREKIIHGPVYIGLLKQNKSPFVDAVVHGELLTSLMQQSLLKALFLNVNVPVYQTIIHYSGEIDTQFYMPPIHTQLLNKSSSIRIDSTAVLINRHYSPLNFDVSSDINVPSFQFKSKFFSLNIDSLYMSFVGTDIGISDMLIGDAIIAVGLFDMVSGVDQLALRGLVLHSLSSEINKLINVDSQLNIQKIFSSNHKFGPLVFNFKLNGINYTRLSNIINNYGNKHKKLVKETPVEVVTDDDYVHIIDRVSHLIKQIEITHLNIMSELGELDVKFNFTLESVERSQIKSESNLSMINLDLDANTDSMLLKQLISWELENDFKSIFNFNSSGIKKIETKQFHDKKISKNLQQLIDESWLVFNGNKYHSKIALHKGKLLVNNRAMRSLDQIIASISFVVDIQ